MTPLCPPSLLVAASFPGSPCILSHYSTLPGFEQMTARNKAKIVKAVAAMLKAQTARLSKRATGAGSPP